MKVLPRTPLPSLDHPKSDGVQESPTRQNEVPLLGGIEAGGTKYVCAVAGDPATPLREKRFPTRDPESTIQEAVAFFREATEEYGVIRSIGIGTFGPADLNPRSPGYGSILTTPKEGWSGFNIVNEIRKGLDLPIPIAFETDVNAAIIGEAEYGAAKNCSNVAYVTVGTGIGGAFLHNGTIIHGRMHPEIGHLLVPDLDSEYGKNTNVCPFHASCLEGRASGPSIEARWGMPGHEIPDDHPAWELQAKYLAYGCLDLTAAWSPDIIILGGGVAQKSGLLDRIRHEFEILAGGYWSLPPLNLYLQTPGLDQQAGIIGALSLAKRLL
ncbi:MAG: ROK family protein [Verrucomicrobiales bacterium]|jgi:fructokinase|nr:ROK family protein [Verrucomicrobiales bacterium]MBP9224523.1 ROK family protein [Verrucomicrobiales bacterium]